ncbi:hypothetical protein ACE193_09415 [Bernardetia sp. OM2101]|uniref:hypothetical protein n=1 Tax=Bernardetia sp. OM2101 TaxID=3344876 RepID=UPI0035CF6435
MKNNLLCLVLFFTLLSVAFISKTQSEKALQNHLVSIEKAINSSSVDTLFLDFYLEEELVQLTTFYKNDLLLKTQISFVNQPKKRVIYYFPTNEKTIKSKICYIKEFDTITNTTFVEIKYWKDNLLNPTKIKEEKVEEFLKISETEKWRITDLEQAIFFKKIYRLRKVKAEIIEMSEWEIIACGFVTVFETYKFKLIEKSNEVETIFLGVVMCPDFKKEGFFEEGKLYNRLYYDNF